SFGRQETGKDVWSRGPSAAMVLTLKATRPESTISSVWQVYSQHADVTTDVRLTAANESLMFLDVDIPPNWTVTGVTAHVPGSVSSVPIPSVRQWTQSAARLEVWLDKPCKQVSVRITGTMMLSPKLTARKAGRFVLSGPRLPWTAEEP